MKSILGTKTLNTDGKVVKIMIRASSRKDDMGKSWKDRQCSGHTKRTKRQAMIHKTLHRELKIEHLKT
jgi:hypothetical protein